MPLKIIEGFPPNINKIKHGDYIYWQGDDEVPEGVYVLDGSKWNKLIMYDEAGVNDFPLKKGVIIDNANNRNMRRILQERGINIEIS